MVTTDTRSAWIAPVASTLLVAALLLLSHPFGGIQHDGVLYAGEALKRLLPNAFNDDLYFYYGSQGRFTLLPQVYAELIRAFGLGRGTIVGMLTCLALYAAGSCYLVAWLVPARLRLPALFAVILGWTYYGGLRIFGYSEIFLTARSVSEPLILLGFGLLLRGRRVGAFALLLVAMLVHPLSGATGVLVAWVVLVRSDRRWWWAAAAALLPAIGFGVARIGPFADLFSTYDAEWLKHVKDLNAQAFVTSWSLNDFGVLAFDFAVAWLAVSIGGSDRIRSFGIALMLAAAGSVLFDLVAVDLLNNPFAAKLQIWRTVWLLQWTAMVVLPLVVVTLWRRGGADRLVALLLVLGWMAPFTIAPGLIAVLAVLLRRFAKRTTIGPGTTRLVLVATVLAGVGIAIQYEVQVFKLQSAADLGTLAFVGRLLAMNLVLMALGLGVLALLPRHRGTALVVALGLFVVSTLVWDQRSAWSRELESHPVGSFVWTDLIAPDAKVYWYRELMAPWVLLGHGNYYTQQQGSGAVFSRDLVIELAKRQAVSRILDFQEQICRTMNALSETPDSCEPDLEVVRSVCTDGDVDYIVLQSRLDQGKPLAELATHVVENGYEKKFYLYRCASLKSG